MFANLLTKPVLISLAAALLASFSGLLFFHNKANVALRDLAASKLAFAEYREKAEKEALGASEAAREREHNMGKANESLRGAYEAETARNRDLAARLRAGDGRLREYAATLPACSGAGAADTGAAGRPADPAGQAGGLADMVGELDDFAGQAAEAADECGSKLAGWQRYYREVISGL